MAMHDGAPKKRGHAAKAPNNSSPPNSNDSGVNGDAIFGFEEKLWQIADKLWGPRKTHWSFLQGSATPPIIGKRVDDAMVVIDRRQPDAQGVLPKDYGRIAAKRPPRGAMVRVSDNDKLRRRQWTSKR